MRVAVAIVTRGRPASLAACMMSAWRLQSGRHDVEFVVGVDVDDDRATDAALEALRIEDRSPIVVQLHGAATRGDRCNTVLMRCCRWADIVTFPGDRCVTISPGWDAALVDAVREHPTRVIWWQSPFNKGTVMPAWGKRLLEAMEWRWSSGLFPFWFDDTWSAEVDAMLHPEDPAPIGAHAHYAGHFGKTRRLRHLSFWYEVFARSRTLRYSEAKHIAGRLGIEFNMDRMSALAERFTAFDKHGRENAERFEHIWGDPDWEADKEYVQAAGRAASMFHLEHPSFEQLRELFP